MIKDKRMLLIGSSTRAMAESAVSAGYNILTVDYFGDMDQKKICTNYSSREFNLQPNPKSLYRIGKNLKFDALVYTSSFENHPGMIKEFEKNTFVLGNSSKTLSAVRSFKSLYAFLDKNGIKVPELWDGNKNFRGKWVVKPKKSCGGHSVHLLTGNLEVKRNQMIQKFIDGVPCSAQFIANGKDCEIMGVTEQLIGLKEFGGREFKYCGNIFPLSQKYNRGEIKKIAKLLTLKYGLKGANGFDFILKNGKIYVLEVNPRYTAAMELIEKACGLNIFERHANSVMGRLLNPGISDIGTHFGKAILYAKKDFVIQNAQKLLKGGIKDVPHDNESIRKGKPICTIVSWGKSREDCLNNLRIRASEVEKAIY